ncbi:hypothetical protein HH1059_13190 [Halorhodospira halochloris]|uniref:Uncharacterized protein n=1 Tax=Halorhodospira halochloris TaxID=1052 RepID=A0A0X8X9L4_HALHR|nr:hypothetical protein HH1059_13190 [Halorhodospira halochloris]
MAITSSPATTLTMGTLITNRTISAPVLPLATLPMAATRTLEPSLPVTAQPPVTIILTALPIRATARTTVITLVTTPAPTPSINRIQIKATEQARARVMATATARVDMALVNKVGCRGCSTPPTPSSF